MRFIESSTDDKYYEQRVKGRLRKFYQFAQQKLDIDNDPFAGPA